VSGKTFSHGKSHTSPQRLRLGGASGIVVGSRKGSACGDQAETLAEKLTDRLGWLSGACGGKTAQGIRRHFVWGQGSLCGVERRRNDDSESSTVCPGGG
jgi:hypothetical protein